MILRSIALPFGILLLGAADYPPPPPQLEPYIKDGQLDPGDYGWMKGRFADATAEEKTAFHAIEAWTDQCRETALGELRTRLRALGHVEPQLDKVFAGPLVCQQAMFQPRLADYGSFAAFQQELAVARPAADAFLSAVALAGQTAGQVGSPAGGEFVRQALTRRVTNQAMRSVYGGRSPPGAPQLSPAGAAIFQSRIGAATFADDHRNTEWLKAHVAGHGWPKVSEVGEGTARTAWLLVQHADADPLFQLEVLGLMEPLLATGEASKQNYAFLYDRVMLKLAGKQRYATQFTCRDGALQPLPLEDEAKVDRLRAESGLPTVAEYKASLSTACVPPAGS